MKKPSATIAIPTLNREEVLIDTIHNVLTQSVKDIELIVVDQTEKHKDETIAELAKIKDERFRYFRVEPKSVTAARNFALKKANADIIIYIDDDVVLKNMFVHEHLKVYCDKPDVSAVAGRVNQKGFPNHGEVLHFNKYGMTEGIFSTNKSGYTNSFPGGNCSMKVDAARFVNGFDTRYYGNSFREESDMAHKIDKAGYKIYFEPKAALLHLATPYGGNRTKKELFDTLSFYKNELFFTFRAVRLRHLFRAIILKYRGYCFTGSKKKIPKRSGMFLLGFVAALFRLCNPRQVVARGLKS